MLLVQPHTDEGEGGIEYNEGENGHGGYGRERRGRWSGGVYGCGWVWLLAIGVGVRVVWLVEIYGDEGKMAF